MKCMNCNNEAVGRSKYCSDKCKVAWNRNKKRNTVTGEAKIVTTPETAPNTQKPDEQETVQATKSDGPIVEQPDFNKAFDWIALLYTLPDRVTMPTGKPTPTTTCMTSQQLKTRRSLYKGLQWISSPEYAETIYRLLTLSIEQLNAEGQFVPAWRLRMPSNAA